ncbi:hypothetical protein CKO25_15350 [Thiocapsa imhoffii]|uniref:Glutamate-ammonia-ligase adenylyltransferase n=1 Tax=Thiocapsa imhoffii TaxID=382777 RepID=A0A9X0WKF1_9GAMM|nr:hypothetical protein [Thiocapsa imhoffii]MBK1645999.1 hypothetical protein [Thiocapsa imhoffii]
MDRFTRIYSIAIGVLALVAVAFWIKSMWQPDVWELDAVLETDQKLASYPYRFRVVAFDQGVATLSTPRSFDVPAYRFLAILDPSLGNKADNDPAVLAAQQDLIDHQQRAQGLILALPEVQAVDWELDTQWLSSRGIMPAATPSPRADR